MIKNGTISRDEELRKRYFSMLNSGVNGRYIKRWKIIHMIAKQPAPRFYIAPKVAQRYVSNYYKGTYLRDNPRGRAMIKDLVSNYERLRDDVNRDPKRCIWTDVVASPAKSFYLSEFSINSIIFQYVDRT